MEIWQSAMESVGMMLEYYRGKKVFITGHTGFKGAWLTRILQLAGAEVTGYSLAPLSGTAYVQIVDVKDVRSYIADIREIDSLKRAFDAAAPEVVIHLAAQPLVLEAFAHPVYTFDVNVQGTVNLLECVRESETVKSVVIVTTDKVYQNNEWCYGYRENDVLGDTEPYAASKACVEIIANSFYKTYFSLKDIAMSTLRAGNVIGGGDVSSNRIIPDCIRAAKRKEAIRVRNPYSVRPYQHVLEPLFAYLMVAQRQAEDKQYAGSYNVGPDERDCVTTAELVDIFCREWGCQTWVDESASYACHESGLLKLDCAKICATFAWRPKWNIETAIEKTILWEKYQDKPTITDAQIQEYGEV